MFNSITKNRKQAPIPVYLSKRNDYPELNLFKNEIEVTQDLPMYKPYSMVKSSVLLYRTIFLAIGVLYFFLGMILFVKTLSWSCSMLLGNCAIVKTMICSLCFGSSLFLIGMGMMIKAEKEAVKQVFRQAKKSLQKVYDRKVVKFGIQNFFAFGTEYRKSRALKQHYHDALEKIQEHRDEALHLVERIGRSSVDKKEELFNQAVLEFKDKIGLAVGSFKTATPQLTHLAEAH